MIRGGSVVAGALLMIFDLPRRNYLTFVGEQQSQPTLQDKATFGNTPSTYYDDTDGSGYFEFGTRARLSST